MGAWSTKLSKLTRARSPGSGYQTLHATPAKVIRISRRRRAMSPGGDPLPFQLEQGDRAGGPRRRLIDLELQLCCKDAAGKFAALDLNWWTCIPEEVIGPDLQEMRNIHARLKPDSWVATV